METVAFCEIEPYCRKVLAKHWPDIPIHNDIRELSGEQYRGTVDLVCGGFPCQPFSVAGKRRGTKDDRDLWPEMRRLISEVRPAWVVAENVADLASMEFEQVFFEVESETLDRETSYDYRRRVFTRTVNMYLDNIVTDLETLGYDVLPPLDIPACGVDAHHIRHRIWIVANASGDGIWEQSGRRCGTNGAEALRSEYTSENDSDANSGGLSIKREPKHGEFERASRRESDGLREKGRRNRTDVSDAELKRWERRRDGPRTTQDARASGQPSGSGLAGSAVWLPEPRVGRVATGIPNRVDRLRGLGNAVIPQIVEVIGRAIMEVDTER